MAASHKDTKFSPTATSLEYNILEILRPFASVALRCLHEMYYIEVCDTQSKIINLKSKIEGCSGTGI